ncbi:MAG: hypothetical protein AB8G05_00880 [Oligoflexales bacterium]
MKSVFILVVISLFLSTVFVKHQKENDQNKELKIGEDLIYRYISQPSVYRLTEAGDTESIRSSANYFLASNVVCALFFFDGKLVSSVRSCGWIIPSIDRQYENFSNGRHLWNGYFTSFLRIGDLSAVAFFDNSFDMGLYSGIPYFTTILPMIKSEAADILFFFIVISIFFMVIMRTANVFNENKSKGLIIHDFSHASEDLVQISNLVLQAESLKMAFKVAETLKQKALLQDATLNTSNPISSVLNLKELLDNFLSGFFVVRSLSWLEYKPCHKNIFVETDIFYFYRILVNVFDNAYNAVSELMFKDGEITRINMAVSECDDYVKISVKNKSTSRSLYYVRLLRLIPGLFPNKGIKSLEKSVSKVNGYIDFIFGRGSISVAIFIPKGRKS